MIILRDDFHLQNKIRDLIDKHFSSSPPLTDIGAFLEHQRNQGGRHLDARIPK